MSDHCPVCPALQQQVAELHHQVMLLAGGIQSTLAFIDNELDEPTMPRSRPRNGSHRGPDLISSIQGRLDNTLNSGY